MTTTDPFTEAANDEAGRLDGQYDLEWESPHQVFVRGAEWARDYIAAQEPTPAEVQEAAVALLAFIHNEPVERIREVYGLLDRDGHWSTQARVALSAARRDEETARMDDIDDAWGRGCASLFAARAARDAQRDEGTR